MRWKKKQIVVEAIRFTDETKDRVYSWAKEIQQNISHSFENGKPCLLVPTLEGEMTCSLGDYLIKEPFPTDWRKIYPCKAEIFEKTYDLLSESPSPVEVKDIWNEACKTILRDIAKGFTDPLNQMKTGNIRDMEVFEAIGTTMESFPIPECPYKSFRSNHLGEDREDSVKADWKAAFNEWFNNKEEQFTGVHEYFEKRYHLIKRQDLGVQDELWNAVKDIIYDHEPSVVFSMPIETLKEHYHLVKKNP